MDGWPSITGTESKQASKDGMAMVFLYILYPPHSFFQLFTFTCWLACPVLLQKGRIG